MQSRLGTEMIEIRNAEHQRDLAVFKRLQDQDRELRHAFDDPRRSTAVQQLALLRARGLLTDDEFAQFGQETRDRVETFVRI